MKNYIGLLITLFSFSCISSAQMRFEKIGHWSFYKAIAGEHTVQTIRLSTGVQLEYVEQGNDSGIPLIFLHGLTDSWHSFETTMPFLPETIHAFAITQRGHGNSTKPVGGYSSADFASDVAAFVRQKNLGPVFIAGHSMGGVNAQQFALDYPQLVRGVIIIDSDPAFKNNIGMPEFYEEVLKLGDELDRKFMDEFQKSTLAKPIDSSYYELLVNESLKVPGKVFKQAFKGLMETDLSAELQKMTVPVLVFWGERDSFCSRDDQDEFINRMKNARLIIYEGTGHALHWERPGRFAADLVNFIGKVK